MSAVLNSPVANAFVAVREGKTDVTIETLRSIPVPRFTGSQATRVRELISHYQAATTLHGGTWDALSEQLLKEIDAAVLDAYRLPPRVERELLEFFRGHKRPTRHPFGEYIPKDCDFAFSLSRFLAPNHGGLTAKDLLSRMG